MTTQRILPLLFAATLAASGFELNSVNFNGFTGGTPGPTQVESTLVGPAGGLGTSWNQYADGDSTGVMIDATNSANYEVNLVDLINDLRAEFGKPGLPISITTTSMDPPATYTTVELAQLAMNDPVKYPAFVGNVKTTDARTFWRVAAVSPSNFGYHWNHNGESQYLNGKAMGEKMVAMLGTP